MNVLIVGANGFLGRYITKICLDENMNVDCVDKGQFDNIPYACNKYTLEEILNTDKRYNIVFLVAAIIPYSNLNSPDFNLLENNSYLPYRIIEKFRDSKIVYSSTVSVYKTSDAKMDESSLINPSNFYAYSKYIGELMLKFHNNAQIIRFSSIYGSGMNYNTFLPVVIMKAIQSKCILLYGDGSRAQDYIHVKDAAELCLLAGLSKNNSTYLGVTGTSYSNLEVAKIIQKYIPGCQIEFTKEDNSPSFFYDNSYTKKKLNFQPNITLEEGIIELIENG